MSRPSTPRLPLSDPAGASVVAALESDPFYLAISAGHARDPERRRAALAEYFAYSIQEGQQAGRCVRPGDPALGVAVWLLPQPRDVESAMADEKSVFLAAALGEQGFANYRDIVGFMTRQVHRIVARDSWYLSIVAVSPSIQGRGLGRQLLEPTLAEADAVGASCYLETFSGRSTPFYERLGFVTRASFDEPTTHAGYAVMVRTPVQR